MNSVILHRIFVIDDFFKSVETVDALDYFIPDESWEILGEIMGLIRWINEYMWMGKHDRSELRLPTSDLDKQDNEYVDIDHNASFL